MEDFINNVCRRHRYFLPTRKIKKISRESVNIGSQSDIRSEPHHNATPRKNGTGVVWKFKGIKVKLIHNLMHMLQRQVKTNAQNINASQ